VHSHSSAYPVAEPIDVDLSAAESAQEHASAGRKSRVRRCVRGAVGPYGRIDAARVSGDTSRQVVDVGDALLCRQSSWNLENRFTGWVDVPLTERGREEAATGGSLLRDEGYEFDLAITSVLRRAITTCNIALEEMDQCWIPIQKDFRWNERHYGALSGLNKAETAEKHGEAQVKLWRRSYDIPPPAMEATHPYWQGNDRRYAGVAASVLPKTESLKDTYARVSRVWDEEISPLLREEHPRLLIVAHGNSLRALVKHLDKLSDKEIIDVNIPTGVPLVYTLDESTLSPVSPPSGRQAAAPLSGFYLGDPEEIAREAAKVAAQASARA
jgi:2,3-bisphosphoglycerate-dependent phosphoglycerate mutase